MPEGAAGPVSEEELLENSRLLEATLLDFGVRGKVGEVHPGPVITRFEFEPAPGVKVNQILNREDDLALALRASRIRIVAPIPGKAAVGIEIPNRSPQTVYLKEIVASPAFQSAGATLPLALGKEISGEPFATDLARMPHLLIAGTTGSGKSVCVNSILTSLLLARKPGEMRLVMVDPKMLELTVYNGIPHLLAPVITDSKQAGRYLRWLIGEMERRYRLLAGRAVRNIQGYNDALAREMREGAGEPLVPLPYIVLVIDELADLMTTSSQEVEEPIGRLAQTARAVGIHLLLATQRPSVDVITGVIKANFPSRIAFQVASRTDSRTILDMNGAESLLGKGDMLFLPPGLPAPIRIHGAFVSDTETERIVAFLRRQPSPTPAVVLDDGPEEGGGPGHDDPLFEEAKRLVVLHQQGSTSLLQRRLKIGYSHAARLMDMLEAAGVVGPQMGSKAREVLLDESALGEREGV
jgi:S-DNA-T family DNA segregation ATPase FtsK/SpoIIIE